MQGSRTNHTPLMRRPALRWLVLLFTCAWFGVLLPVHNRGAIQLPGSPGPTCCQRVTSPSKPCHQTPGKDCPPGKPAGNCAVCYFVAGLDLPVPVMLDVPPLGPAEPVARFELPAPAEREHTRARCERGPPLA